MTRALRVLFVIALGLAWGQTNYVTSVCWKYSHITKAMSLEYANSIIKHSTDVGLDPYIIARQVECESRFRTNVVSSDGCIGIMQVKPMFWTNTNALFTLDGNLFAGCHKMRWFLDTYGGGTNYPVALIMYACGPSSPAGRRIRSGADPYQYEYVRWAMNTNRDERGIPREK